MLDSKNPHLQPHENSDLNPFEMFSLTNPELLTKIASGHIPPEELQHLAKLELAGRGVDKSGSHVGYDTALKDHFPDFKHGFEEHS